MPKLRYVPKTTYYVNYNDLEAFISSVYGVTLDLVAAEEASNANNLNYDINSDIDEWDKLAIHNLFMGNWVGYGTARLALKKICADGHISEGNYTVIVSW